MGLTQNPWTEWTPRKTCSLGRCLETQLTVPGVQRMPSKVQEEWAGQILCSPTRKRFPCCHFRTHFQINKINSSFLLYSLKYNSILFIRKGRSPWQGLTGWPQKHSNPPTSGSWVLRYRLKQTYLIITIQSSPSGPLSLITIWHPVHMLKVEFQKNNRWWLVHPGQYLV